MDAEDLQGKAEDFETGRLMDDPAVVEHYCEMTALEEQVTRLRNE